MTENYKNQSTKKLTLLRAKLKQSLAEITSELSQRESGEFLETEEFKNLVAQYKKIKKQYNTILNGKQVTEKLTIPVEFEINLNAPYDLSDVICYGEDLTVSREYNISCGITKTGLTTGQHDLLTRIFTDLVESDYFDLMRLFPNLSKELQSLTKEISEFEKKANAVILETLYDEGITLDWVIEKIEDVA